MDTLNDRHIQSLDLSETLWDRVFTVAPLVIIGTEEGESYDMAPKHMVTPLGFGNYFGFVCTPRHSTFRNIQQTREFTASFPKPDQIVQTSLSATPRSDCYHKAEDILQSLSVLQAKTMRAPVIAGAYLYLECDLFKIIDGFDDYSLITGTIRAAYVDKDYLKVSEWDEREQLMKNPLLAYIAQGRFAKISETYNFPFPKNFKK
ncbi:NADH-FMN oxidoreductase RutF, flavin reductase (DIM6/NTAB) family [Muriicola jejuensis]|uniref:Flavin reductase n=1 Tax=Muriicola jejuensis TaxID=504488 RepID=A0A6P0UE36_9FLAO|nr:flavin reductase [Muriicola jejuensis]NER10882.1 flavin reductase [Muriicola jejuensis]SMP15862.1 NADH-FMN oxidoreductase RutF, flavin reductase (DIM6/NTAB) family [Muriicola jejuensis]